MISWRGCAHIEMLSGDVPTRLGLCVLPQPRQCRDLTWKLSNRALMIPTTTGSIRWRDEHASRDVYAHVPSLHWTRSAYMCLQERATNMFLFVRELWIRLLFRPLIEFALLEKKKKGQETEVRFRKLPRQGRRDTSELSRRIRERFGSALGSLPRGRLQGVQP
jgi:hypothetical protein